MGRELLQVPLLQFNIAHNVNETLYFVQNSVSVSFIFQIAEDVYDRGVWQSSLDYLFPANACHLMGREKYRVWHGRFHHDDARITLIDDNHIDWYEQGDFPLTNFAPNQLIPGLGEDGRLNEGDFAFRIESQVRESYILAFAYQSFHIDYDRQPLITTLTLYNPSTWCKTWYASPGPAWNTHFYWPLSSNWASLSWNHLQRSSFICSSWCYFNDDWPN